MGIDDVVSEIAMPFYTASESFDAQMMGFAALEALVFTASTLVWTILKVTMRLRPSVEDEMLGLDKAELGIKAYPDFRI